MKRAKKNTHTQKTDEDFSHNRHKLPSTILHKYLLVCMCLPISGYNAYWTVLLTVYRLRMNNERHECLGKWSLQVSATYTYTTIIAINALVKYLPKQIYV